MVAWILGIIFLIYSVTCYIMVQKEKRRVLLAADRLEYIRKVEGIARGKWKGRATDIGRAAFKRRLRKV